MRIAGILLAAGRGARFGGDKLLAPLVAQRHGVAAGTPLGVASAMHLVAEVPDSIAVVRLRVAACAAAEDGMGASLAGGVVATRDADGWIVALADMPWISPATIGVVAAA